MNEFSNRFMFLYIVITNQIISKICGLKYLNYIKFCHIGPWKEINCYFQMAAYRKTRRNTVVCPTTA